MDTTAFLEEVINKGIAACKRDYNRPDQAEKGTDIPDTLFPQSEPISDSR